MGSLTQCRESFAALYECLLQQPLVHWECAEDGIAAIRDGYCETQQANAASCLEQHAHP